MKSRLDAIWAALSTVKDGLAAFNKAVGDYENAMVEANAQAVTLDAKLDKLQKTEVALEAATKELNARQSQLDSVTAKLAKIKEAL